MSGGGNQKTEMAAEIFAFRIFGGSNGAIINQTVNEILIAKGKLTNTIKYGPLNMKLSRKS